MGYRKLTDYKYSLTRRKNNTFPLYFGDCESKEKLSSKLENDINLFLKLGGKITKLPEKRKKEEIKIESIFNKNREKWIKKIEGQRYVHGTERWIARNAGYGWIGDGLACKEHDGRKGGKKKEGD